VRVVSEMELDNPETVSEGLPYADSWEHISDELRYLDLLIHLQVLRQRSRHPANPLEQLKGLVISEEEVTGLLSDSTVESGEENPLSTFVSESRSLIESLKRTESRIKVRRAASLKKEVYLSLPHLSQLFHLSSIEEKCLVVCLAPELNRKYKKLYSYLQDDLTRRRPSVDLLLNLLCNTIEEKVVARRVFDPGAPLIKYGLLQTVDSLPDGPAPLLSRSLRMDDRMVDFLLGSGRMDSRLDSMARLSFSPGNLVYSSVTEEARNRIQSFIRSHYGEEGQAKMMLVFYFHGPYGSEKRALAEVVCRDLGVPLLIGDVEKMLSGRSSFEDIISLLGREAVLQQASLCLENFDLLVTHDGKYQHHLESLLEMMKRFSRLTFLTGSSPWKPRGLLETHVFIDLEFFIPDDRARKGIWENYLRGSNFVADDLDLGELSSKFRFTPGQIRDALYTADNLARWRSPDNSKITMTDLYSACRAQSNQKLSALARKINPKYTWEDIVLPSDQTGQLREICNQAKYRHIVYGEWGFDRKLSYGKGLNALFSGPSGTGKTMAAEIISNELGLDLYKIDLSQVVSKYIGETEKNLERIFTEAQTTNAILFFDEADALFGKRSEVKDAHDRYANIEIGYLLQKMEEYEGITILATNLRQNMDEAFVRRMQVIVEFPFPDEDYRRRIWEVVFPDEVPLDHNIDFGILAREVKLPGGNIKNIAINAAFYAAGDGRVIRMVHLMQAVRQEYRKLGRIWNEAEWSTKGKLVS
jgi:SpoVK/Ycf46/Vps4 family AAA+-type ATPase